MGLSAFSLCCSLAAALCAGVYGTRSEQHVIIKMMMTELRGGGGEGVGGEATDQGPQPHGTDSR